MLVARAVGHRGDALTFQASTPGGTHEHQAACCASGGVGTTQGLVVRECAPAQEKGRLEIPDGTAFPFAYSVDTLAAAAAAAVAALCEVTREGTAQDAEGAP